MTWVIWVAWVMNSKRQRAKFRYRNEALTSKYQQNYLITIKMK